MPGPDQEDESYRLGRSEAVTNIKDGLSKVHFQPGSDRIAAVATFHNNAPLVAGYISCILDADLLRRGSVFGPQSITIAEYVIAGTNNTFLISYISAFGFDFQTATRTLNGKNEQIAFLQTVLLKSRWLTENNYSIKYYDDSAANLKAFSKLTRNGSIHHVAANNHQFTILAHQHLGEYSQCNESPNEGLCANQNPQFDF